MDIAVETRPEGIAVVWLTGQLDLRSTGMVKQRLGQVIASGSTRLVVDFARVTFVDSSGLAALISGLKAARAGGGDLCLANASEEVATIFEFTRLNRVISLYPTIDDALAAL